MSARSIQSIDFAALPPLLPVAPSRYNGGSSFHGWCWDVGLWEFRTMGTVLRSDHTFLQFCPFTLFLNYFFFFTIFST
ncbi:hypothetical protein L873DRAFT_203378 [Choiromyces venosus 120613-1]|uniref:Uncharacterized protein n=1 Tax=Choiromyces venosus 120613-1 TaxID=1336337 RepID=A0A3N4J1P1_9PEZI|nr:hypothetical protein L873DRAFT_203378 [Choiromyces venosus 120613-1]